MIVIYGFNGVAISSAIIAFSVIGVVYFVKKHVQFDLREIILIPLIATGVMGLVVYVVSGILVRNLFTLCVMVCIGIAVYFGAIYLIGGKRIVEDLQKIMVNVRS